MITSLNDANGQDADPQGPAHSAKPGNGRQALKLLQPIADSASPNAVCATEWGRIKAGFGLRSSRAGNKPLAYNAEQLARLTSTYCANSRRALWRVAC